MHGGKKKGSDASEILPGAVFWRGFAACRCSGRGRLDVFYLARDSGLLVGRKNPGQPAYFRQEVTEIPAGESASKDEVAKQFYELSVDEKIEKASVIALLRYEVAADGKKKAVIKEFLKKSPGTVIYYDIGDEYQSGGYYLEKDRVLSGDGMVVFFDGSPASMKFSTTYYGDRIQGLADLPIELLRDKCSN